MREPDVADVPAIRLLLVALGLHFSVGLVLQATHLGFGLFFGELFFFAAPPVVLALALNFRPAALLGLRAPPPRAWLPTAVLAVSTFFFAGAIAALNRMAADELSVRLGGGKLSDLDPSRFLSFDAPGEAALLVVAIAVCAPLGEELLFRGFLLRVLGARHGRVAAVSATALLFSVLHVNPSAAIALFVLGLVFGLARLASGTVVVPLLLHMAQNGVSVALLASGQADASPDELEPLHAILLALVAAPFVGAGLVGLARAGAAPEPPLAADPAAGHHLDLRRAARTFAVVAAAGALLLAGFGTFAFPLLRERAAPTGSPSSP